MKNAIVTFLLISFALLSASAQTTLILDNSSNDPMHYKTFAEAIEAATAGSTINVEGSAKGYGNITINKTVKLIGPGFNIGANPGTENMSITTAKFGKVTVTKDGIDVFISGCEINDICTIIGDNTMVQRNKIKGVVLRNCNNCTVGQNQLHGAIASCGTNWSGKGALVIEDDCSDAYIHNNYIYGRMCNSNHEYSIRLYSTSNATFRNNIIKYGALSNNGIYENNIFIAGKIPSISSEDNNSFSNNIFGEENEVLNGINGNITKAGTIEDIFNFKGTTMLSKYTIKENSVAKGAGNDGTDAGIFGGAEPFVPSGIPGIPTVYSIEIPTNVTGDNLKVNVKARTNN